VLGIPGVFLNTVGDVQKLPRILKAAENFEERPADEDMSAIVEQMDLQMLSN
jgi:hypothetical protein